MSSLLIDRVGRCLLFLALVALSGATNFAQADNQGLPDASMTMQGFTKLPNGGRPANRTPFPTIADWNTLRIRLERGPCLGTCPYYSVEIRGDGTVSYEGNDFVAVAGKHTAKISEQSVHRLFEMFAKANFFWAFKLYVNRNVTDFPAYRLSLSFDGHDKEIEDYVGPSIGMPEAIRALEDAVDDTANTKKWVKGNDETFASLQAEHWDFHANDDEHHRLISSASWRNNADLVRNLLAAGVQPNNYFGCRALSSAARNSNAEILDMLLGAGALIHADAPKGSYESTCDVLHVAAEWGVPEILRAILGRHPNVNWQDERGATALMAAAENAEKRPDRKDQDFATVAQLLIDAGADVNIQGDGYSTQGSALMLAHSDGAFVRVLLKAGARDINTPDSLGDTPLMNSYDPDVTQALLEGGADPWMVNSEGQTALEIAKKDNWRNTAPVLERWMAAHPKRP